MQEKNRHILSKAIGELPLAKADPRIWNKIEENLDYEAQEIKRDNLRRAIKNLPASKAPETIFENGEMSRVELPNEISKNKINFYFKIAASISLIIGLSILIKNSIITKNPKESVSFTTETIDNTSFNISPQKIETELDNLIAEQCEALPAVCKNPEVTELRDELSDLNKSLEQVKKTFEKSDNDPELYKYIIRIQKEKTKISKKLFQYFNS